MTSPWLLVWLGLISLSLFSLMILVAFLVIDLRQALRSIQVLVPLWIDVARNARQVIATAGHIVAKADRSVGQVTDVVDTACEAAAETLHGIRQFKRHFGTNGARKGPRGRA